MDLFCRKYEGPLPGRSPVEIVERKGLGHPDTICDAIAEHVCVRLCRHYLERFGAILHHNVDKLLLAAGAARPAFGGGEITAPMELYLGGRASQERGGERIAVAEVAVEAAREWLRGHLPGLDLERHVRVVPLIRPGSVDLGRLFARPGGAGVPLANDTSCGAGFAPMTALERAVMEVERTLNAEETKRRHPEIGTDVKVMGVRAGETLRLTVSCAFVDRHVADVADYVAKKAGVQALAVEAARRASGLDARVEVNAGDDVAHGDVYLTVTGTSAEAGDDGEVGRGNRAGGLITPYRPMTMEAAAGKNPVTHVGKLYGLMAGRIAAGVAGALGDGAATECWMLSQIGRPIDDPQIVDVCVGGGPAPAAAVEPVVADVVRHELAGFAALRDELLREEAPVC
jgi:S-adenosylmethionine synthetase